jgi:anthranilate/para-aminobenzoate synthase component I
MMKVICQRIIHIDKKENSEHVMLVDLAEMI